MSRVEDEAYQKAAADAERLQKRVDRDVREKKTQEGGREAFSKLVKGQQTADQGKRVDKDRQGAETREGEKAGQGQKAQTEADRAARMSRGGVAQGSKAMEQAKTFQGALQKAQGETQQADTGRVERRDTGKKDERVEREDRQGELIQKAENKRDRDVEQLRVEAREENRANAAINTNQKGSDNSGGGEGRGNEAAVAALKQKQPASIQAQGAKGAHEVKQIPPELLEKLVSTVYLAVNQRGLTEFQIQLKDGVLSGATLKISAEKGKITLKFLGLDAQKQNLVEASKGELMRRLGAKGLTLARLETA